MARDRDTGIVKPAPVIVDEQAKAAAMRAATAAAPAAAKAIAKTPDELLLDKVNAQIAKLNEKVENAPLDLTKPLNQMTPAELKAFQKARVDAQAADRITTQTGDNPDNPMPSEDPGPGNYWANFGGVWRKYKSPVTGPTPGGSNPSSPVAPVAPVLPTNPLNTATQTAAQVDAIAAISALLSSYGIGDLSASVTAAVRKGYSASTIQLIMQDPNSNDPLAVAFQTRFPANKARLAAGKAVLSASDYLAAERTYSQIFQSYGMSSLAKRDMYNQFITGDVSAAEVSDRISLAVNRVQNADPMTKKALADYYPMLNQGDIVSAMLNPAEGLPTLQRKVQIAEIGGAALAQNLTASFNATSEMSRNYSKVSSGQLGASALAELGITKEQAKTGFAQVAELTPRAEFLSSISEGADYSRLQAEQEAFQGLASAKRARLDLTAQEQARFSASSGMSKGSLGSQRSGSI